MAICNPLVQQQQQQQQQQQHDSAPAQKGCGNYVKSLLSALFSMWCDISYIAVAGWQSAILYAAAAGEFSACSVRLQQLCQVLDQRRVWQTMRHFMNCCFGKALCNPPMQQQQQAWGQQQQQQQD